MSDPVCEGTRAPDAMTRAMRAHDEPTTSPEWALRVAFARRGRIIDEQHVRPGEALTIGPSADCDIVVSSVSCAAKKTLLTLSDDGLLAEWRLPPGASARARIEGALRRWNDAGVQKLPAGAQGVVTLSDDERLLVSRVSVDPERPVAPLDPALRRGLLGHSIDWLLTFSVGLTTTLMYLFTLYMEQADAPYVAPQLAELPAVRMIFDAPTPPPMPPPEVAETTDVEEAVSATRDAPRIARRGPGRRDHGGPSGPDGAVSLGDARQQARQAVASVLGSIGGGFDEVRQGGPIAREGDVMESIASAQTVGTGGITDRRGARPNGDQLGQLVASAGPAGIAVDDARGGSRHRPITRLGRPRERGGIMQAGVVTAAIRRRLGGIRRCYDRVITRDPTREGKITIAFVVTGAGTLRSVRAVEDRVGDPQLTRCVTGIIGRIRVPAPEGGEVRMTYPFMFRNGG